MKHGYAERLLSRYQSMFGDQGLSTEVRYWGGRQWQPGDPLKGSVRLDVVAGDLRTPTAIYDYKFGGATLSSSRIAQILRVGGFPVDTPVIPLP